MTMATQICHLTYQSVLWAGRYWLYRSFSADIHVRFRGNFVIHHPGESLCKIEIRSNPVPSCPLCVGMFFLSAILGAMRGEFSFLGQVSLRGLSPRLNLQVPACLLLTGQRPVSADSKKLTLQLHKIARKWWGVMPESLSSDTLA